MITPDQVLCHMIGDYILQSDWMAQNKTKKTIAALAHVATYSIPFLVMMILTGLPIAKMLLPLLVIVGTHFIIDRWRLARYVVWAKNWISPIPNQPWTDCSGTGYHKDVPIWLSMWLLIIVDNTMHILINGIALYYLV